MSAETEVVLIDLSSIAYPIWHVSQAEPDPNAASQKIVARVRALASAHPHAAICCDSGRSFRHALSSTYKANRPEHEATLHHQIDLAKEQLAADGFPIWAERGFEADDIIATATRRALAEHGDVTVLIVSADKDLLQLVGPRVRAMSVRDGSIVDAEAVGVKFGVRPEQMRDYLSLVGDASDNIKGAKGIGPKKASDLLAKFGSLDALYAQLTAKGGGVMGLLPAVSQALREFAPQLAETRALVSLRDDVELPFADIFVERTAKDIEEFDVEEEDEEPPAAESSPLPPPSEPSERHVPVDAAPTALAVRESDTLAPTREGWELEPRSMKEAKALAVDMFQSRLFSAYGHPAAILSTVMAGRELGMQAMASLRAFHIIEGRPTLAADLIRALVIRSGAAKYFRCTERTAERATFETQRGDDPPIALSYTLAEAQGSGRVKESSAYKRDPADVLVARASSKLARLVFPDVVHGLYSTEEMD